jgi:hypothetical protein
MAEKQLESKSTSLTNRGDTIQKGSLATPEMKATIFSEPAERFEKSRRSRSEDVMPLHNLWRASRILRCCDLRQTQPAGAIRRVETKADPAPMDRRHISVLWCVRRDRAT